MHVEHIRQMYSYSQWAFERVWNCVRTLGDDGFAQPLNYSIGSIRSHFLHVTGVEERWFARLNGTVVPPFPNQETFGSIEQVYAEWSRVTQANLSQLARWTDEDMMREIVYDIPHRGGIKRNPMWQILVHVVNHATDHRSQILAGLHTLGAPTVEQDMIFYFWEQSGG